MARIDLSLDIKAAPEAVFDALATPAGLSAWWTAGVEGTGDDVGSAWVFRFRSGAFNRMLVVRSNRGSDVSWSCTDGHPEWVGTSVRFRLDRRSGATRLEFRHDGWQDATDYMGECADHWHAHLESLKSYCENGAGTPDPGPTTPVDSG